MCSNLPILHKLPVAKAASVQDPDRFWSCSHSAFQKPERATEKQIKQGNYVQFRIRTRDYSLHIIDINEKYCNPPEKECTRDKLIDKMLTSKEGWNVIQFDFSSDTCQFILRAAEKLGFKYATIINPQLEGECAEIKEVDSDSKEYESSPIAL